MNAVEIYEKAVNSLERGDITLGEFETQIAVLKDVEPVVRCKDCTHCTVQKGYIPGDTEFREFPVYFCKHPMSELGSEPLVIEADDFCSYGERRTDV